MKHVVLSCALAATVFSSLHAQRHKPVNPAPAKDTTHLPPVPAPRQGPKPYKDVVTAKAVTHKGLFTVHQVDDKWYFELPDSMFNRDIMAITRYSKTPGGGGVYGGELVNQQTIEWEKGPANTVFMRVITLVNMADSTSSIYKAVTNSNLNPIAAAFDIKAVSADSAGVVIDVTDFFKGDNQAVSLSPNAKRRLNVSALSSDRSYIDYIHTYPINTEVKTVKTFSATASAGFSLFGPSQPPLPAASAIGAITMELNTSFILLPKQPMQRRFADARVGFFADDYTVYGDDQQKVQNQVFIVRWRLEPKPEDVARWEKGELVEPQKPIVYYIDPATPKQWRKYLVQGVNDWQQAFEKAGFKNAVMAKEWPDSAGMSTEDARFSMIRYFASDIENAYGPNVHDPRSGEIIESHIGWYHNVMKLVHDWYMIQAAAVDPAARKMKFDDELMGQLIRFVSSHEIGHTLGLRHNWGSSSTIPVEMLRNKAWLDVHGHTPSIMDYARFNYVAQPEDHIPQADLFPHIGEYDRWAIQWGYTSTHTATPEADRKIVNRWIVDSLAANPRLWFGAETHPTDARSQNEDLGDDAMKASAYGIKNLQRILAQLPVWTSEEADTYTNLKDMYTQLTGQFSRYMGHVLKNVGGINETPKSVEQGGNVYEPTPKAKQKEAVAFLNKQLFETPFWLLDKNVLNKFSNPADAERVAAIQTNTLKGLLSAARINSMLTGSERFGVAQTYTAAEMLDDAKKGVWSELSSKKPVEMYRRNLQKAYIAALVELAKTDADNSDFVIVLGRSGAAGSNTNAASSDASSLARAQLAALRTEINAAMPGFTDKMTRYHLQDIADRIKKALDPSH
ncbi:zinc-dependent metalloprotease [Deminuibacter soli]|uniref:DUF5117 domain-containing protein n=1 Tax=Deminuibacter soli TaxID=2291815 RepID=A0A3E1NNV6_9BACT|nr:zinc-dependent metalloprotease [Deminuibacter soli]RFM29603.1 DUF5117 domain-containing protein [Deminuibacter soli]